MHRPQQDSQLPEGLTGLTADSRAVRPGMLFAALPGTKVDGRDYIADAVARGAVAVLVPADTVDPVPGAGSARVLRAENARHAFARMAAAFHPTQPEAIAAVTGTNGKTSTVQFLRQIWSALGLPAASIGTLGIVGPKGPKGDSLTTPDPVALHAALTDLVLDGTRCLAMEASSHGLDQYRLDGVRVGLAGFTQLSRDHLDYHGTMAAYLAAKSRLFTEVLIPGGTAVLNADAPESAQIAEETIAAGRKVLTSGRTGTFLRLVNASPTATGLDLILAHDTGQQAVHLPVAGLYQADNATLAAALAMAAGAPAEAAIAALGHITGVRGRVELVGQTAAGAAVYVDYAHTPDALATVLQALRPHATGKLVVVFGAGGDRDPGKRPLMGKAAAAHADSVIVTDDNPRSEDPGAIRAAILPGCPGSLEIGERRAAIRAGIEQLSTGDLLVIAGKGHEQGQDIGSTVLPFDDASEARKILAETKGEAE